MKKIDVRFGILAVLVLFAALSRLLPLPPNFTAIGAMALFGGAYFTNRWSSVALPLVALFISDLILNNVKYAAFNNGQFIWFHGTALWVYGAIAASVVLGWLFLKQVSVKNVALSSLISAVLFFIVTNFGVWASDSYGTYPKTLNGLMACFTAAIPFFGNTLVSQLLFSAVLFGGFELAQRRFAVLRTA
jgi:hypothetical protein